jgi:hypothetical protein
MPKHEGQVLPASYWMDDLRKSIQQCPHKAYSEAKAYFLANHHPSYTQEEIEQRLIDLANLYGV